MPWGLSHTREHPHLIMSSCLRVLKIKFIIISFDYFQFSVPTVFLTKKLSVLCLKPGNGIRLPFKHLLLNSNYLWSFQSWKGNGTEGIRQDQIHKKEGGNTKINLVVDFSGKIMNLSHNQWDVIFIILTPWISNPT